jgi:hypothetical protein
MKPKRPKLFDFSSQLYNGSAQAGFLKVEANGESDWHPYISNKRGRIPRKEVFSIIELLFNQFFNYRQNIVKRERKNKL